MRHSVLFAALALLLFVTSAEAQNSAAVQVAKGDNHSCALLTNGAVRCWGANGSGQVGNNTRTNAGAPQNVSGLGAGTTVSIAARGNTTCAVMATSGQVKCWGANNRLQVGSGATNPDYLVPTDSIGATGTVSVVPGL